MTKVLPVAVLSISLHGCLWLAAVNYCDDGPDDSPAAANECAQLEEAALEADKALLDAATEGSEEPLDPTVLHAVQVQGLITDAGTPVARGAVRVNVDGDLLAIVRTEEDGTYQLHALVEAFECETLRISVEDAAGRWGESMPFECGEQVLDYDFTTGAWWVRWRGPTRPISR